MAPLDEVNGLGCAQPSCSNQSDEGSQAGTDGSGALALLTDPSALELPGDGQAIPGRGSCLPSHTLSSRGTCFQTRRADTMADHGAAWPDLQREDVMRHAHEVCRNRMGAASQNYFSWDHPRYLIPCGITVRCLWVSGESERNSPVQTRRNVIRKRLSPSVSPRVSPNKTPGMFLTSHFLILRRA